MTLVEDILNNTWLKNRIKIYYDDVNMLEYICDAERWTLLTDNKRRIRKVWIDSVSNKIKEEQIAEDWNYNLAATDMSLVESYNYS